MNVPILTRLLEYHLDLAGKAERAADSLDTNPQHSERLAQEQVVAKFRADQELHQSAAEALRELLEAEPTPTIAKLQGKLAAALRVEANQIINADTAELVRVLARIVEGQRVLKAFGAPGEWGYGTPIGNALAGR